MFNTETTDSLGFPSIQDPGPPKATHVCVNTLLPSSDFSCTRTTIFPTTTSSLSVSESTSSPTTTTTSSESSSTTDSSSDTTQSPTSTTMTVTSGTAAPFPSISSLEDPGLTKNLTGVQKEDGSGGLSTAAKIIIAAAVAGAILVALIAVIWHCRYRKRNKETETSSQRRPSLAVIPPGNESPSVQFTSPSPTYLGPDGAPLTPPPRLKERRMLSTGSSERLVENRPSRLRPGFHLPTSSRAGVGSVYGSTGSPTIAVGTGVASVSSADRRTSVSATPNPTQSPLGSPYRSQFSPVPYASSLADPGPPPNRELPSTPVRAAAAAKARSQSRTDVSPSAIGVALDFPPQEDELATQVSISSGNSSESRIMTGPLAGQWRDSWVASEDGRSQLRASPPAARRRPSRSPILEERDLERMAGTY